MEVRTFLIGENISYKEVFLDDPVFYKYYEIIIPDGQKFIAFPDGLLDIQVGIYHGRVSAQFVGSNRNGNQASTSQFETCFGIKFNPGVVPQCLNGHIEELVDNRRLLSDFIVLDMQRVKELFRENVDMTQRIAFFQKLFAMDMLRMENDIIGDIMGILEDELGNVSVADIVGNIGYSHRHCDRIFKDAMGFSIKKYAGIIRLQNAMRIMISRDTEQIYDSLGYYDQAHFIHDFKRFTSLTPNGFARIPENMKVV